MDNNGPLHIGPLGGFITNVDATVGSVTGSSGSQLIIQTGHTLTTGSDDSSTTFGGMLVGNGGFRKVGAGTFTLATGSSIGGSLFVDAGKLRLGNGTLGPGSVQAIAVNGTIEFDTNNLINVPGPVTGIGDVWIKAGTRVQHMGFAPFTHQGTTTIEGELSGGTPSTIDNNGAVLIAAPLGRFIVQGASTVGSVAGAGRLDVNSGSLTVGGDNTSTTFSGQFTGNGEIRKVGTGTFTVTSNSFPTGEVTIEAPGTLQLGNGVTGPGALNAVTINGTLLIDTGPSLNLGGAVTGTGNLRVQSGSSVFNGSSFPLAHQGATIVNGNLDTSAPITSIDNNGPLVIGPSGVFTTRTGQVGSLSGSGQINASFGTFVVGGDNSSTTYSGSISGNGEFRKTGSGTLTLATTTFFGGDVIVEAPGSLRLGDGTTGPSNVNVSSILVDGGLLFNTPNVIVSSTISGNGSITIQSGSVVNYGAPSPMTHSGTTIVSGQLVSPAIAAINNNSPLLLSGTVVTRGGSVGSVAGSGSLQLTGNAFTTGGNNLATAFAGALSGNGNLVKAGTSTFTLSGASPAYAGQIQVATGTLQVAGSLATTGINVVTGATLNGNGTITGPVNVEIGGNLAPGTSVGTLTTGNLSIAGNFQVEIQGTAPGTQHDRLNVNGTVAINGAALVLSGGYLPVTGNSFTIIQNDGTDAVTGTFAGLPEGATLTFNGASLRISYIGGTGNDVVLSLAAYTVTPSASANGSISPNSPQVVSPGNTISFTVSPNVGYAASVGGTCGGSLSGTTYTTNPVNSDCTVVANFTLTTLTVTPSAGPNGSIAPSTPQPVAPGGTLAFTVTPNTGYTAAVGGTCGGNLVGATYTTNPVNSNCTVLASFSLNTYTVTPTAGPNGTISPSTPQTVAHGAQISFTVTAGAQFTAVVGGTCGGSLAGNIYTSNPITASCTVAVTFEQQNPPRLANISTRLEVLTGDDVLIGGFVIGGTANKTVAVVATGPSLAAYGITNPLANPNLLLVRSSDHTVIAANDDWQTASNAAQLQAAGFAPSNSLEAAVLVNLAPGAYTAVVQGAGSSTGVATVAVYEVDAVTSPLVNISTRGRVQTGNGVMIGGFIIQGYGPQTVAIVAPVPRSPRMASRARSPIRRSRWCAPPTRAWSRPTTTGNRARAPRSCRPPASRRRTRWSRRSSSRCSRARTPPSCPASATARGSA
jgi:autotransporter-associated beta strand protein